MESSVYPVGPGIRKKHILIGISDRKSQDLEPRPDPRLPANLRHWRDAIVDYELLVDDCRQDVDRAVEALQLAVWERDRAAHHLAELLALAARQS